jgi:hypothetical protein
MKLTVLLLGLIITSSSLAQKTNSKKQSFAEASFSAASYRGSLSVSVWKNLQLGEKRKFGVGLGLRYTGFLGANIYYITAPAELTSGETGPFVLFKENITDNIDSLLVKSPQVHCINLAFNLNYQVSPKVTVGFNIDALGFSFGKSIEANYINGIEGKITTAKPTEFNVLLISDNDRGSLNSEFYGKYKINDHWGFKLAIQFLFTEYTTATNVQQFPAENDRFRNKSLLGGIGVVYNF